MSILTRFPSPEWSHLDRRDQCKLSLLQCVVAKFINNRKRQGISDKNWQCLIGREIKLPEYTFFKGFFKFLILQIHDNNLVGCSPLLASEKLICEGRCYNGFKLQACTCTYGHLGNQPHVHTGTLATSHKYIRAPWQPATCTYRHLGKQPHGHLLLPWRTEWELFQRLENQNPREKN